MCLPSKIMGSLAYAAAGGRGFNGLVRVERMLRREVPDAERAEHALALRRVPEALVSDVESAGLAIAEAAPMHVRCASRKSPPAGAPHLTRLPILKRRSISESSSTSRDAKE